MDTLARLVHRLHEEAKHEADRHREKHPDYWKWYIGQHWDKPRPSYRASHVANFIFSNIETIKPILTDHRPNMMVLPRGLGPDDQMKAKMATQVLRFLWDYAELDMKVPEALTSMLVYGTGFAMPIFDGEAEEGKGQIDIEIPHPTLVDPDPLSVGLKDMRFFTVTSYVSKQALVGAYGTVARQVVADASIKDMPREKDADGLQVVSAGASRGPNVAAVGQDTEVVDYVRTQFGATGGGEAVKLIRAWIRDESSDPLEQDPEIRAKRYPTGRLIHVANGVVLRDVPNPWCGPPLVRFLDHALPSRFWGMGEVQQVLEIQKEINKRKSQIIDNASLTANPQRLVDTRIAPEMLDRLTNEPGLIVEIENPEGVDLSRLLKWEQPPTMPTYVVETLRDSKRDMEIVSGIHDVTQGRAPSGIEAGVAIEALQTETKRRIGLKLRNMEYALSELGRLLLSGVQAFWTEDRVIRLLEQPIPIQAGYFKEFDYDVRVESGSSLPVDKAAQVQEALAMLNAGVIDEQAVLEIKDPPDKQQILQRMAPIWQAKKQTLMMNLMGPPPGAMPPQKGGKKAGD